jgi:hypothetical protein
MNLEEILPTLSPLPSFMSSRRLHCQNRKGFPSQRLPISSISRSFLAPFLK